METKLKQCDCHRLMVAINSVNWIKHSWKRPQNRYSSTTFDVKRLESEKHTKSSCKKSKEDNILLLLFMLIEFVLYENLLPIDAHE